MRKFSRRNFFSLCGGAILTSAWRNVNVINTVTGPISLESLGICLIHEHFLVDFIGADKTSFDRWNRQQVTERLLPLLNEAKTHGVKTIFDCTPAYLGRDVVLLQELSTRSGINIVTNTGFYGAVSNKYLPEFAKSESKDEVAARWISEFNNGIDGTSVKPGFIKISVDSGTALSELHEKLVRAAAIAHLATGLTICSHTGPGITALEQIEVLKQEKVLPSAFVWVHAQAEKDKNLYIKAAKAGAYVSLDGIGWGGFDEYVESIDMMKKSKLLQQVLISHDSGWYKPEEPGAKINGYTNIFTELIPRLKKKGFTSDDIDQLLVRNPRKCMKNIVRKV